MAGLTCALCGRSEMDVLRRRHIVPVCEGGTADDANLRLLCRPCHVNVTRDLMRRRAATSAGRGA